MAKLSRSIGKPPKVTESADAVETRAGCVYAVLCHQFRRPTCKLLSEFVSLTRGCFAFFLRRLALCLPIETQIDWEPSTLKYCSIEVPQTASGLSKRQGKHFRGGSAELWTTLLKRRKRKYSSFHIVQTFK